MRIKILSDRSHARSNGSFVEKILSVEASSEAGVGDSSSWSTRNAPPASPRMRTTATTSRTGCANGGRLDIRVAHGPHRRLDDRKDALDLLRVLLAPFAALR